MEMDALAVLLEGDRRTRVLDRPATGRDQQRLDSRPCDSAIRRVGEHAGERAAPLAVHRRQHFFQIMQSRLPSSRRPPSFE